MRKSPKDLTDGHRTLTRRALIAGGLQLGFFGVLAARMHQLQVQSADEYRLLAEENRIDISLLQPERGLLFDRNGVLIAGNEQVYRLFIKREEVRGDLDGVLSRLGQLVTLNESQVERARREMRQRKAFVPVLLADGLTWEEVSRVAINTPALPGLHLEVGQKRRYPLGADFAHTIGYLGRVSERDLEVLQDDDPLLRLPDFEIGQLGVERRMDATLRGQAGTRRVERNAVGRIMRELGRQEGTQGANLRLTLDAAIQNFTAARLGRESASVVVMDLKDGNVLAAVSSPSYDPNLFIGGISHTNYNRLLNDDHRPLHNKIVQGLYPPGSTFKMITLLAALEEGIVDENSSYRCSGHITVGNRRVHCWKRTGHGRVDAAKSLIESCDTYYYEISQKVGIEKIAAMARKFGLGESHDVPMTSVSKGLIPDPDWKLLNRNEPWQRGDTLNASIGQGFVLASPLQLAIMTARLATGRAITARMVSAIDGIETPVEEAPLLDLKPENLRIVREAMFGVNNGAQGTARSSRIADETLAWSGKTGTSQVRNITAAERARGVIRNEDLPWNRRDHALYVGFAPHEDPRYAISVVIEHGGGGSTAAAPVARDVMLATLGGGRPDLNAYPKSQRKEAQDRLESLPLKPMPKRSSGTSQA